MNTNSKTQTTAEPKERIEFKINRPRTSWEETPVTHSMLRATKAEAQAAAQEIANKYQRVIRWNVAGSYQGHYTHPNTTKEAKEEAKDIMEQTPQPEQETGYNGWKNRSTWNVSLWLNNDEGLYNAARRAKANGCNTYAKVIRSLGLAHDKTPDGIGWISNRLDYSALDAMIDEL